MTITSMIRAHMNIFSNTQTPNSKPAFAGEVCGSLLGRWEGDVRGGGSLPGGAFDLARFHVSFRLRIMF